MEQNKTAVQVLVATMNQKDFSKVMQMHLKTDAVFANQTDRTAYEEKEYDGFAVRMISTQTRGVGVNRNLALAWASGEYLLLADDDLVYQDGYEEMVISAFRRNPDADAIIFNVDLTGGSRTCRCNSEVKRVRLYNALNYGAVRIAVRRESLMRSRITFTTCFGGGTLYSSGEDTLFLCDMLRAGFRIYTAPETIAVVDQSDSSWFRGYTRKYLYDKGALYCAAFPAFPTLFCLQALVRHREMYKSQSLTLMQALKIMREGIRGFHKLEPWTGLEEQL